MRRSTSAQSVSARSALSVISEACGHSLAGNYPNSTAEPHARGHPNHAGRTHKQMVDELGYCACCKERGLVATVTPNRQIVGYASSMYRTGGKTFGMPSRRRRRIVPIYGPATSTISVDAVPRHSVSSTHLPDDFRSSYGIYNWNLPESSRSILRKNPSTIWKDPVRSPRTTEDSGKDYNMRNSDNSRASSRVPSTHGLGPLPTKMERSSHYNAKHHKSNLQQPRAGRRQGSPHTVA